MFIHVIILILTAALMLIGLAGSILPFLPGSPLILLGAFIYAWYTDFTLITWSTLAVLSVLVILSQLLDYLASILGAKKFGASRWGMAGALIGGITGLLFGGVFGILIGPFVGAFLLELFRGREMNTSLKVGLGTLIGFLGGVVGKFIIALTMVGVFLAKIIG